MADDASPLYQILGPDGQPKVGAVAGPEWLAPDEKLGPQIDTSGKGTAPAALAAKPPPTPPQQSGVLSAVIPSAEAAPAFDPTKYGMVPAPPVQPPAAPSQPQPGQGNIPTVTVTAKPPTPPAPPTFDPTKYGMTPAPPAVQPPVQKPPPPQPQPDLLTSTAATLNAIPRGVLGGSTIDYGNAAMQTPLRMLFGWQGPTAAFQQGLQREQGINQALQQQAPLASTAGELTGGLGMGVATWPLMGWERGAATTAQGLGNFGSYLARNASMGGLMSGLNGGDITSGALTGSIFPMLHGAGSAVARPFGWAYNQLSPLWSQAARERSVGQTLAERVGQSPVQTSPVGPLSLTEATNNPTVAGYGDVAPTFNDQYGEDLANQQRQQIQQQIGQIGAPGTAADISTAGTNAIRDIRQFSRQRERELWNHPALTDFLFNTQGLQDGAASSLRAIQRDDPGLLLGMTGPVRGALHGLSQMPGRANLANINSYLSVLRSVARSPPMDNPRAGALAARLLGDLERARDATVSSSGAPTAVTDAYDAARDFTRRSAGVFGTQDMRGVLQRNPAGLFTKDPSEAMKAFFNFTNGSPEGPRNLRELQDWADEIRRAWVGRGSAAFDQLTNARDTLRDSVRSYVADAMTNAGRLGEGQQFTPAGLQTFLRNNRDWMERSGLFTRAQMGAADALLDYAGMLRRPSLLRQPGSPTQPRTARERTFIDDIVSSRMARLGELGAMFLGGHKGGMAGEAAAMVGSSQFERVLGNAQREMQDLMARALSDPQLAQDLMMRGTLANQLFLSRGARSLLNLPNVPAFVVPQFQSSARAAPAVGP